MIKPFVVITPEADREVLRNSGVLPAGFYRNFDVNSNGLNGKCDDKGAPPIFMWPYNLKYKEEPGFYEDGLFKPDVPGFFGLPCPKDDAEKRHNERLITGLLSSVMVHVVFLDTRRSANGYAVFRSFAEIVKWGNALRRALNIRFRNEEILQSMESVLVIVSRGEQATVTAKEIESFNDCVQQWRGDVFVPVREKTGRRGDSDVKDEKFLDGTEEERQRKIFQSCYFLDYNLCVRDSRELYHSAEVWDVVVGRLLLAFLLSRQSKKRWWQIPGVKLWRSLDCSAQLEPESDRRLMDEALSRANAAIQDMAARSEDLEDLPLLENEPVVEPVMRETPLEPDEPMGSGWRTEPDGGWSALDVKTCVENTCDPTNRSRWTSAFERVRAGFRHWALHKDKTPGEGYVEPVIKAVHSSPGNLLTAVGKIYAKLAKSAEDNDAKHCAEADWANLVAAESERRQTAAQLAADAEEYKAAQQHYVGFVASLLVWGAVCAALGAVCFYVSTCVCGVFALSLPAWLVAMGPFAFIAFGSLLATGLMFWLHRRAGRRAMKKIFEESCKVDNLMVDRDGMARKLVEHGKLMRDSLRLQGLRFRTWALLKRTQDILATELQPTVSKLDNVAQSEDQVARLDESRSVRETFFKRTRHVFGPYRVAMKEDLREKLEHQVALWWAESAPPVQRPISEMTNFTELWYALCGDDLELAGYFPAVTFSTEIKGFVTRFTESVRSIAREAVLEDHLPEVKAGVFDWYERLQDSEYYLYASGAVTGEHVNEAGMDNARVYLADSCVIDFEAFLDSRKSTQADRSRFLPEQCPLLNWTTCLALMFQEIRVRFCSDAKGNEMGRLTFKEVADVPGGDYV